VGIVKAEESTWVHCSSRPAIAYTFVGKLASDFKPSNLPRDKAAGIDCSTERRQRDNLDELLGIDANPHRLMSIDRSVSSRGNSKAPHLKIYDPHVYWTITRLLPPCNLEFRGNHVATVYYFDSNGGSLIIRSPRSEIGRLQKLMNPSPQQNFDTAGDQDHCTYTIRGSLREHGKEEFRHTEFKRPFDSVSGFVQ